MTIEKAINPNHFNQTKLIDDIDYSFMSSMSN